MKFRSVIVVAAALVAFTPTAWADDADYGRFVGKFVAEFDGDGRRVKLVEPYGFVDRDGKAWDVPAGYLTDGASVPAALWVLYPPFTGNYRSAAVIHDYYCDNKKTTWQDTHKVFYSAMRAAGVGEKTAKVLYGAVYMFGPRWGPGTAPGQRNAAPTASLEQQEATIKELEAFVEAENPDLDVLESQAKRMSRRPVAPLRETP